MPALAVQEVVEEDPRMAAPAEKFDPATKRLLEEMARRLEKRKTALGMTWADLSFETRISESLLRKWGTGNTQPGVGGFSRLATALKTSTDFLLQLTDDPSPSGQGAPGEPSASALRSAQAALDETEASRGDSQRSSPDGPRRRRSGPRRTPTPPTA